jgi:UDP-N-acetylmuramoyl-tripeptide--D-alanyl-D-alanine ligase
MSLGEIAAVVGGDPSPGDAGVVVTGPAFVDSRHPLPGGLFAALPGDRVDGHEYAAAAMAGGAQAVLSTRPVGAPGVVVGDVLDALARLARHVVTSLTDLTVVGVTGSQGKTSTKDMLADLLGGHGSTVAPTESFNNELGVPLTALRVTRATRYLVSEMGTRGLGQIAFLASIVRPTVGVVLNVGVAHLGEFGSQDNIALGKGELVEALPPGGLAVLNADDRRVLGMRGRTSAGVLTFGTSSRADLRLSDIGDDDEGHVTMRLSWREESAYVGSGFVGAHQAMNLAAAATVGLGLGLRLGDVAESLQRARPHSKWRMAISTNPAGVVVLNDCYNANPDSMRAAIRVLVDVGVRRKHARTVAVLGDMRELGETSRAEHEALGRFVAAQGVARLVTIGEDSRPAHQAAVADPHWAGAAEHVSDASAALEVLDRELCEGDVVLVKASRATGLESLASALEQGRHTMLQTDGAA